MKAVAMARAKHRAQSRRVLNRVAFAYVASLALTLVALKWVRRALEVPA